MSFSRWIPVICTQRRGTRVIVVLFILHVASSMPRVVCLKVRLPTSKLDNCNEVGSQLPHNAHISTASCLNNPCGQNDVLEVSVRVQNVQAYTRGTIVI